MDIKKCYIQECLLNGFLGNEENVCLKEYNFKNNIPNDYIPPCIKKEKLLEE